MKRLLGHGFTMIELLVVIAIIGVLAAIMLAGFNPMKQIRRARDTRRMADVRAIANAQEQYYAEHGEYADLGDNADPCGTNTPTYSMFEFINPLPVSTNSNYPYECRIAEDTSPDPDIPVAFCIELELQEANGNCDGGSGVLGCRCRDIGGSPNPGTCWIEDDPNIENTQYCIVHQQ